MPPCRLNFSDMGSTMQKCQGVRHCCLPAVLEALNEVPKGQHGVDIMRVREWYLSGSARQYRQTILLSSFASAEVNALFNRSCSNHAGKVRLKVNHKVRDPGHEVTVLHG